ncbi:Adapter-related protein complex 3 (AP-3) subunit [Entamoeba marina]
MSFTSSSPSMPGTGSTPEPQNLPENNQMLNKKEASIEPLRKMLFSTSDKDKLSAVKSILKLEKNGVDVSDLFAEIAMSVGSQDMELRKLVCMFIVSHSERDPTNSLMAVNTMHKALSSQHSFVRSTALQSITSLRVKDIAQLMVIAVTKALKDSSPYVRKAAALSVVKIYALDERRFDECVHLVSQLLEDKNPIVLGSACHAFNSVCPDRFDLLHKHFIKICQALIDCEEWGQISILTTLLHYGRTQFTDPNLVVIDSDTDIDKDLSFMIQSTTPLFYSMNPSVVVSASLLVFHVGHTQDRSRAIRSIMKLTSSSRSTQYFLFPILLSLATQHPSLFTSYLDDFFLYPDDPRDILDVKLDIITRLVTSTNCTRILDELRDYTTWSSPRVVSKAIQAMSRLAIRVPETSERCMVQLLQFMSSKSPEVVAEAVIGIKKLLQLSKSAVSDPDRDTRIIAKMSRLLNNMKIPNARASIVWVIGEYSQVVPKIGPDILRILAKSFVDEEDVVKQQVLTFAGKLLVHNRDQSEKLVKYIFKLAMYDISYDIRDRERLLRRLLFDEHADGCPLLRKSLDEVLLAEKPTPVDGSANERQNLLEGTLSHYLNTIVNGYMELEDFALEQSSSELRQPVVVQKVIEKPKAKKSKIDIADVDIEGWLDQADDDTGKHKGVWGRALNSSDETSDETSSEDGEKQEKVHAHVESEDNVSSEVNEEELDWDLALGLIQNNLQNDEKDNIEGVDEVHDVHEDVGDDAFEVDDGFVVQEGGNDDWGLLEDENPIEKDDDQNIDNFDDNKDSDQTQLQVDEQKDVEHVDVVQHESTDDDEQKEADINDFIQGGDDDDHKDENDKPKDDVPEDGFASF